MVANVQQQAGSQIEALKEKYPDPAPEEAAAAE
jgi:hypothetical protein